ncbi:efflux RND transporter permease subunit [Limnoglobus roseus]|uniref:AcrB/AcrD/AcrF family protein n=1 Tax=Limnoglobus roseus TaxID=2598579 RepID=A0A5C1A7Y1_9BACT|nr:efflux RND transporter permease subunit [Limnoglobus roseus]QEL14096.1 AcrB/AcrD/AcrF family protein [Limnoglobus roseus]
MVKNWISWAVANPLIVMILTVVLAIGGGYAFVHVNIEAYPDPAPAIIEVVAQFPGASAEEVERQVTVPLEVALAGMPGLDTTRSKSLFGLSHIRNQFTYAREYEQAKQDVLNRLASVNLPAGVTPQISPASPIGEILRFTIKNPKDPVTGKPIYTLSDLKATQEYVIQRELLRVPRVAGVTGVGGTIKRYEIQPDPDRLRQYGVSLAQLQTAVGNSNANGSGDNLTQGQLTIVVRSLGLLGNGQDPQQQTLAMANARTAAEYLRSEEARRCREIRQVVVASVNNVPVRVDQLVDGGPCLNADGSPRVDDGRLVTRGVVIGYQTRQGRVGFSKPHLDADGNRTFNPDGSQVWDDEDDVVQGIVLLRKGQESLPALKDVLAKVEELNQPGHLPPGMQLATFYNRTTLIDKTTETVHENLLVGMALVTTILLMFLGNVRAAVIVALNIPLALLFAFGVLLARGKSANLLSIGAVDFGIIVDSSVIIVESIYRNLMRTDDADRPIEDRILAACGQVTKSVFFATVIMVCALLPLFTMSGPEGQIFGPMADTYAFALGGALILAMTVSPVLCYLLMKRLKPKPDNVLVRALQWMFLVQLRWLLHVRWLALAGFVGVLTFTGVLAANMGREFMPELEEGNLMVRGTFPVNVALGEVSGRVKQLRKVLQQFPEFAVIVPTIGRPDDGTDPTGYYNCETFLPLRSEADWPVDPKRGRPRKKAEMVHDLEEALDANFPGVDFDISQIIRDNVMEALSGVKGENSIKVFGPDLDVLEQTAANIRDTLNGVPGVQNAGVFRVQGQSSLEFPVDRQKCARWNVSAADVQAVIQSAVGGRAATQMQEGGRLFDVTVRWPARLRADQESILAIPVPVGGNQVTAGNQFALAPTPASGGAIGLSPIGTTMALPSPTGDAYNAPNVSTGTPVRRLSDLVTPLNAKGQPDEANGSFLRPGASTIYREQGQRLIAIKFEVRGRDLASTVAEARAKVDPLLKVPYRAEWSGEFKQMEAAEGRMAKMFLVSLVLIVLFLYLAFHNFLDTLVVLANVLAMGIGGVWALRLAGLNFNISAAVGFISVLGVAVMNGLLFVSAFNGMRAHGVPLNDALLRGTRQLVRPVVMTALAAILGLLPAALSTKMGSESQKPLAVVVVGGMLFTIVALNLVPVLYSFYGRRTPPAGAGDMAH